MSTYSRITIVPSDTVCTVDGVSAVGVDMSSLPDTLHAMQWYGTWGEEEIKDPVTGHMQPNNRITSLDGYESVLASYAERLADPQQLGNPEALERTITEV